MSSGPTPAAVRGILEDLSPAAVADAYRSRGLDSLSDADLVEVVARSLGRPKAARADSFILHAPLELMARAALLPRVDPGSRELARQQIVALGARYEASGDAAAPPAGRDHGSVDAAVDRLVRAVDGGELDDADDAASWLASALPPTELSRALADAVLPRLSAAAHGCIALFLMPRVLPRSLAIGGALRGLVRELAREPEARLRWFERLDVAPPMDPDEAGVALIERLRIPRAAEHPEMGFIRPMMELAERSGLAAKLLGGPARALSPSRATPLLTRVAAWSMLQDDPGEAPYGWSHTLTLPQAALGLAPLLARPTDAVAVAATYVLGLRGVHGDVLLDPRWAPPALDAQEGPRSSPASPSDAAARAWHTPPSERPRLHTDLATRAAIHPDAHLAKYTLACFDAASADPAATHVYLAASAYLAAWWGARGAEAD